MYTLGIILIVIGVLLFLFSVLSTDDQYFSSAIIFFIFGCICTSFFSKPITPLGKFHISEDLVNGIYLSKEDLDSIYNEGYREGIRVCQLTACPEDF